MGRTSVTNSSPLYGTARSSVASSLHTLVSDDLVQEPSKRPYRGSSSKFMPSGTKLRSNTFAERSSSVPSNSLYICDAASVVSHSTMA